VTVDVRRAGDRAVTRTSWLDSRHSFSYGDHYDPANTHFGLLLACNEDRLAPGTGFAEHRHRDVEVLTWVVSGVLRHADDAGHRGEARPGVVQRMSAGSGVRHSEHAGPAGAHYVQMWLQPAVFGAPPSYDTLVVGPGLVSLSPLRQPAATLHAGQLAPGGSVTLPAAPYHHVLVVTGTVTLAGQELGAGDAARLTGGGPVELRSASGAELIAWGMRAGLSVG
jgi:hypothetical protein